MYPIVTDLDGIYFRVKRDNQYCNICLCDLTQEEREDILENKPREYLNAVIEILVNKLREIYTSNT